MTELQTPNHERWTAFYWQPVHKTYQMPLIIAANRLAGVPGHGGQVVWAAGA